MRRIAVSLFLLALAACAPQPPEGEHVFSEPPEALLDGGLRHTETIMIEGDIEKVIPILINIPLEDIFEEVNGLPAIAGTEPMTENWGGVGSARKVFLADGHQAAERILEIRPGELFRYQVWGFTNEAGYLARYAIGEFRVTAMNDKVRLDWTYAFYPKPFARAPLWFFVSGTWSDYMKACMKNIEQALNTALAKEQGV